MITILNAPSTGGSGQDDIWHVVTSDNSGQTDFKYVFDIYINDIQKIRVKKFPEPSNGYGYFDASPIIKNSFTYDWFTPIDDVYCNKLVDGEMTIDYDIQIGEDYSGVTTLNDASATTTVYNYRQPVFQRRLRNISNKLNKFMTNRPMTSVAGLDENLFIGLQSDASGLTFKVTKYNYSNDVITAFVDSVNPLGAGFTEHNLGPAGINGYTASEFIDASVKYYDVWFNSFEALRVYLNCAGNYTPILLHFVNEWGMFDTARFSLVSRLTMDVERKAYSQRDYSLSVAPPEYMDSNSVFRESKINYGNKYDHSYKLTMDAPTDEDYQWLAELINSPLIYAEIDGYYYPVTIKNNNYEYSTVLNNRLKVLEIDIELNQTRYSHQR